MSKEETVTIQARQLQPGMYVYIDMGWMAHPFPLNRFKLKSAEQIRTILALGIAKIRYSPEKSDVPPLPDTPEISAQDMQQGLSGMDVGKRIEHARVKTISHHAMLRADSTA